MNTSGLYDSGNESNEEPKKDVGHKKEGEPSHTDEFMLDPTTHPSFQEAYVLKPTMEPKNDPL